jgi:flagellar biosynthesis protein FlhA
MLEGLRLGEGGSQIVLDPTTLEQVLTSIRTTASEHEGAVLVCAPQLRPAVRKLAAPQASALPVLSYTEATQAAATIETIGVIRVGTQTLAA